MGVPLNSDAGGTKNSDYTDTVKRYDDSFHRSCWRGSDIWTCVLYKRNKRLIYSEGDQTAVSDPDLELCACSDDECERSLGLLFPDGYL
jgi:hypothetical protein